MASSKIPLQCSGYHGSRPLGSEVFVCLMHRKSLLLHVSVRPTPLLGWEKWKPVMKRVSCTQSWGGFLLSYDKQSSQLSLVDSCVSRGLAVAWVGSESTEQGGRCLRSVCSFAARAVSSGSDAFFLASAPHMSGFHGHQYLSQEQHKKLWAEEKIRPALLFQLLGPRANEVGTVFALKCNIPQKSAQVTRVQPSELSQHPDQDTEHDQHPGTLFTLLFIRCTQR